MCTYVLSGDDDRPRETWQSLICIFNKNSARQSPPPYLRHTAWSGILQRFVCLSSCTVRYECTKLFYNFFLDYVIVLLFCVQRWIEWPALMMGTYPSCHPPMLWSNCFVFMYSWLWRISLSLSLSLSSPLESTSSLIRLDLSIPHSSHSPRSSHLPSVIITTHHLSPHHSSFPTWKFFFF